MSSHLSTPFCWGSVDSCFYQFYMSFQSYINGGNWEGGGGGGGGQPHFTSFGQPKKAKLV